MNKKDELQELLKEKKELLPLSEVSFKSKKEGAKYIKKNYTKLSRLNDIEKEIERLEWELMSPEEKEQYLEEERISKLKREGKL